MGDVKKVIVNESYITVKNFIDYLKNQQSSSESAPKLFPNVNNPTQNQSNNSN